MKPKIEKPKTPVKPKRKAVKRAKRPCAAAKPPTVSRADLLCRVAMIIIITLLSVFSSVALYENGLVNVVFHWMVGALTGAVCFGVMFLGKK